MKRLLGLLLVMGIVGCGGGDEAPMPNKPQAKVDDPPVQAVDAPKWVERDGLWYEGDSETPFTGVRVEKHENGNKKREATYKDGKVEGLWTGWHENGQKAYEKTLKDDVEEGLWTSWQENGQKAGEEIYKDGEVVSGTRWDEEGNEIK